MSAFGYSMPRYFQKMQEFGSALRKTNAKNAEEIKAVEAGIDAEVERIKNGGKPTEQVNASGEWTAWQRSAQAWVRRNAWTQTS